jgi:uridine kinase
MPAAYAREVDGGINAVGGPLYFNSIAEQITKISSANAKLNRNTVVSICGGSCTGKTTQVAAELCNIFNGQSQIVSQDHFMLASLRSDYQTPYRWDHPDSFNLEESARIMDQLRMGVPCTIPLYSFQTRNYERLADLMPSSIIFFEGLYTAYSFLADCADYVIYVQMPLYTRIMRRLIRNLFERYKNIDPGQILEGYLNAPRCAHQNFVISQRIQADVIYSMPYTFSESITRFNLKSIGDVAAIQADHVFVLPDGVSFRIQKVSDDYTFSLCFESDIYFQFKISHDTAQTVVNLDLLEF